MFRRSFSVAAGGALALLLTAAGAAPAQVAFFPAGFGGTGAVFGPRGGFFFPGGGYGGYGGYNPSFYRSYGGYSPYYNQQSYYPSYTEVYATTPMYYGAASLPGYAGYNARLASPSPDTALRAATGVGAAAYETQNYPILSPNYTSSYPVSPPLSVVAAMTDKSAGAARVEVHVPDDAQLWFDGQKTTQTGTERFFTSPGLEAGETYVYDVRAVWTQDGKAVDQMKKVTVHAGDRVVVDFLR